MVGTDFWISTRVLKVFRTRSYCDHVIREYKIRKSWFNFLNLCLFVDFALVITTKEVPNHFSKKNIFNFWRQICKLNDFLQNFWKISGWASKSKNPSRPFTRLFISLFVAKNRLLISSKTAALCDPQKIVI